MQCGNEFMMRRDDDWGDYFMVDPVPLIEASTWYNDSSFPTVVLESTDQTLKDGTNPDVTSIGFLETDVSDSKKLYTKDAVVAYTFTGWETASIEVNMKIGYEKLPLIYVIPPMLTINFRECEHMPDTHIPIVEDLFLEKGEIYYLTINDSDFEHYDAWCYGY